MIVWDSSLSYWESESGDEVLSAIICFLGERKVAKTVRLTRVSLYNIKSILFAFHAAVYLAIFLVENQFSALELTIHQNTPPLPHHAPFSPGMLRYLANTHHHQRIARERSKRNL
jgi:hypothetical protein